MMGGSQHIKFHPDKIFRLKLKTTILLGNNMNFARRLCCIFAYLGCSLFLPACSGGGGGDEKEISYSFDYPDLSVSEDANKASLNQAIVGQGILDYLSINQLTQFLLIGIQEYASLVNGDDEIYSQVPCSDGGRIFPQKKKEDQDWRLLLTYQNCKEGDITFSGKVLYSFPNSIHSVSRDGFNVYFSSFRFGISDTDLLVVNGRISSSSTYDFKSVKADLKITDGTDVQVQTLELDVPYLSAVEEENSVYLGRLYYEGVGYIQIQSDALFEYSDVDEWPIAGPQLKIFGEGGQATAEILPNQKLWLEFHEDNKLTRGIRVGWSDLDIAQEPEFGAPPVAVVENLLISGSALQSADNVILQARSSADDQNKLLSFHWQLVDGPEGHQSYLSDADSPTSVFHPDSFGTYNLQLIVSDGLNQSEAASMAVTVDGAGAHIYAQIDFQQNIAGAEMDRTFTQHPVFLNGSSSYVTSEHGGSPDFIALKYEWTLLSKPNGSNASMQSTESGEHFFIPDVRGIYEVGLIARNGSVVSFENKQRVFVDEYETYYLPGVALNDMPFGYVNQPVELSITGDSAFGTDASSSDWRLVEYPEGSLSPELRVNGLSVNFTPDAAGKYVFEVTSRNEYVSSNVHVVEVYVSADTLFDLQPILIPSDFGDASPIGRIPKDLIVEDYNADNLPDIFLPLVVDGFHPEQETLILSKSDPLNHFSVSSFSTPTEISSLLISDFNDEGHSALVFRDSLGLTIKEAETLTELNSLLVENFFTISNQGLKLEDVNL